ncbi:proline--tRNA ligase [Tumebacillus permanentifrigoris]|uniref:Proline--tRNA ligase n=1 Tax=Tumebacillus permanentifrigoris TaxID=378543 RepID=A0A316D996_9BACL|nr:proline--tRNA ligase [Tumebacillus permanentifrigoris]PWK12674.1 prolyl-tRNA synthetase [Tumebacillus permanentifrigoris]
MRQNRMILPTLREVPKEAEVTSHKLMLRAGLVRQLVAGVYTYLPLGLRVLKKIENIVREEMNKSGAQELQMSVLQPAELWHETGRWDDYGPELVRLKDRHSRDFVLGPTHEEVITSLIKQEINSYKKLPINVYQIQTKFRDERRPRFGLMRGREFLMKDAYSFHTSYESLSETYDEMYKTYNAIFNRVGLKFRPVQANAGAIGGSGRNHEFMVLADVGEDTIAICDHCDYAANLEQAEAHGAEVAAAGAAPSTEAPAFEKIHTPNTKTIDQLVSTLGLEAQTFFKTLLYVVDDKPVAVVVRGDHEVNELKLKDLFDAKTLELADDATIERVTGAPTGFIGPVGLKNTALVVDKAVAGVQVGVAGANERDYHLQNVVPGRDFALERVADIRNVVEGDTCPSCKEGKIEFYRGIECGHIFELGTKYSVPINATFLDENQKAQTMIMGCYGIGVSRIMSAVLEQSHDDNGIVWPLSIAPFQVHLIPVNVKDETQVKVAEQLYTRLQQQGIEVLMDDRDERAGVKFKDSDLIGLPVRVTVGKMAGDGIVEFKVRQTGESKELTLEQAFEEITGLVLGQ